MAYKKKLIEVALPLEEINAACVYEKMPGIGPHPRGIHLWWARRPLAATRAVIWSSLVDDPSAHPEQFPTEEAQNIERERLFDILRDLVLWENSNSKKVLDKAKAEIMKSTDGNPPALLDPFAGGGAIPLEAQRLGLEAHASDLNPVAVMINKAMIEIPPKFANQPPVNPEAKDKPLTWEGAQGLADDVRYYGNWMKEKAFEKIGHLYPKVKDEEGVERTVIAWLWTRTVKCPNPACGREMPLINSYYLAKKKNRTISLQPLVGKDSVSYKIINGEPSSSGTVINRRGAKCIFCNEIVDFGYIREEGKNNKIGRQLMAVVAEGRYGKKYLEPTIDQIQAANVSRPIDIPVSDIPEKGLGINIKAYGFSSHVDLFTNRQLIAISTFSDLIDKVFDAILDSGGSKEYSTAVTLYLAFCIDRCADFSNALTRWVPTNEKVMNLFGKQTISMTWDYPEANVLSDSVGGFSTIVDYISKCIETLPLQDIPGIVNQADAQSLQTNQPVMISTDPPYYDNIGYADLSDFFYIWLRHSVQTFFPSVLNTLLVPKSEELIANPYRFDGNAESASDFFETGMQRTFQGMYDNSIDNIPMTVYYAFKQSESRDETGSSSRGWETMLNAIINSGFMITGTWPIRTEQTTRNRSLGANALATSIVLVCRKRSEDALITTRRDFMNTLKRELKPALDKLQISNIAPVDLAQSAIGPGMAVFSRYAQVLEADGSPMSVRTALQIINQELDHYFSDQDGELDPGSRFCIDIFSQYAFNDIKFGEAEVLSRAKGTSVDSLARQGVLYAEKGVVRLLSREDIPEKINKSNLWLLTQQLTQAIAKAGVDGAARIVSEIESSEPERAKALAYRLYTIAERKKWASEAFAYNALVTAWPEVQVRAATMRSSMHKGSQAGLFD